MHLKILALDLDGTLAKDGQVSADTWQTLRSAKAAGFILILVTGRRLSVIPEIGPFDELCEAIVAENGAAIYYPRNDTVITPFGRLAREVIRKLEKLNINVEFGKAIAATWIPHDKPVLEILSRTGYAATVEYNKGAVMILPPGATKGTGLKLALEELGYSIHNVLACGDAENDRSMFEQADLAVAVFNAIPAIKDLADVILPLPNGLGCREMLTKLMEGRIPAYKCRPDRRVLLGRSAHNVPICLSAFNFLDANWGIIGDSGTGKTWLAGLVLEQMLRMGYQACVVDPEGDYRSISALPRTIVLGDELRPPPPVTEVITLLEYAHVSMVLDLCMYSLEEKKVYVRDFLQALSGIRAKRGVPHWFLLDEAHYFCENAEDPLCQLITNKAREGGFAFVTYQLSGLPEKLRASIQHWMITRVIDENETRMIREALSRPDKSALQEITFSTLPDKQFYLGMGTTAQIDPPASGITRLGRIKRTTRHVRHLHKYLIAPLPAWKQFYFHQEEGGKYVKPAGSLWEFSQALSQLPVKTLRYHLERQDFERWLSDVVHDEELARQLRKLDNRKLDDPALKQMLCETVAHRFEELESLI